MPSRIDANLPAEFELKHRIAGAVILVFFAVIALPAILNGSPSDAEIEAEQGLSEPMASRSDDFVSRIIPIGPTTVTGADPVPLPPEPEIEFVNEPADSIPLSDVEPQPVVEVQTKIMSPEVPEASPAGKSTEQSLVKIPTVTEPTVEPKPAAPEPVTVVVVEKTKTSIEPVVTRGWVVRVGTFSVSKNALRILQELRAKGFNASSTKISTTSGASATRVWVGPVAERVQAARLRTDIERKTGEKGLITAYP